MEVPWWWCFLWCFILPAVRGKSLRPPRITEQPSDVLVRRHEPATLNCKAEGAPPPAVDWYHNGQLVPRGSSANRMVLPSGALFFLHVVARVDTGSYWCVARNELGRARSRNATLEIAVLREEFRAFPRNVQAAVGEAVTLECVPPRGHPEPTVSWRKDREPLPATRVQPGSGSLHFSAVRREDRGRYTCVAENVVGVRESPPALLSVHERPYLLGEPEHQTALVGDDVTFRCQVGGDPLPLVTWQKQQGKLPTSRAHLVAEHSLQIKSVTPHDAGVYICEAENPVGVVSASATLTVHSRPQFTVRPPEETRVGLGAIVRLECTATGSPVPTVFWSKEGDQALMFPGRTYGRLSVAADGSLAITGARREDAGYLVCSAISPVGSAMARSRLLVTAVPGKPPPVIVRGPTNQTLPAHSSARLPCEARGPPAVSVRWALNSAPLPALGHRALVLDSGTLQIDDLQPSDSGMYTCTASSESGETSWSAALAVESPSVPNVVFRRAPDPSSLPGNPTEPAALNVTQTSVTLTWSPPDSTQGSLLGYTVEYWSPDLQAGWLTAAHRVPTPPYVVPGLRPDTDYIFLVRAENGHGMGPPSTVSALVHTPGSGDLSGPEDVDLDDLRAKMGALFLELADVRSLNSTACKLFWKIQGGSPHVMKGLYVRFKEVSAPTYNLVTVLTSATEGTYVLTGLRKFSQYQFFLVPFHRGVKGPPSNTRTAVTLEDVPSAPPENVHVEVLNGSSATVFWSPPPPQHLNGHLSGFWVEVWTPESSIANLSTNGTSLALHDLEPGAGYLVHVAALTAAGPGPPSRPLRLNTDTGQVGVQSGSRLREWLHQPWVIALLGALLCLVLSGLAVTLLLRRRHLFWQKALGGHLTVSVHKAEDKRNGGVGAREALWINQAWHPIDLSASKPAAPEYASLAAGAPDYAEVDTQSMAIFYRGPAAPPAPYATTTLISTAPSAKFSATNLVQTDNKSVRSEGNKSSERMFDKVVEEGLLQQLLETDIMNSPNSNDSGNNLGEDMRPKVRSTPRLPSTPLDPMGNGTMPPQGCFAFPTSQQQQQQPGKSSFGHFQPAYMMAAPTAPLYQIPWSQQPDPSSLLKPHFHNGGGAWGEDRPPSLVGSLDGSLYSQPDISPRDHPSNKPGPRLSRPPPPPTQRHAGSCSLLPFKRRPSDNHLLHQEEEDDAPLYSKPTFPTSSSPSPAPSSTGLPRGARLPSSSLSSLSSDSFLLFRHPAEAANV